MTNPTDNAIMDSLAKKRPRTFVVMIPEDFPDELTYVYLTQDQSELIADIVVGMHNKKLSSILLGAHPELIKGMKFKNG